MSIMFACTRVAIERLGPVSSASVAFLLFGVTTIRSTSGPLSSGPRELLDPLDLDVNEARVVMRAAHLNGTHHGVNSLVVCTLHLVGRGGLWRLAR
jgi:hypothetical protein